MVKISDSYIDAYLPQNIDNGKDELCNMITALSSVAWTDIESYECVLFMLEDGSSVGVSFDSFERH